LAGFEFEFGVKKEAQQNNLLFRDTVELIGELQKRNLLKAVTEGTQLTTTDFYHNEGVWHHGLLRWKLYLGTALLDNGVHLACVSCEH
jgi:hypothetical protein